jgi:hypothetical protein
MRFRQSVILFVLPECIIGIEADRGQWSRRHMRTLEHDAEKCERFSDDINALTI